MFTPSSPKVFVKRMRIALVSVPRMLGDILEMAIRERSDAELVVWAQGDQDPVLALAGSAPDVVMLGHGWLSGEDAIGALRHRYPEACIVALSADGRRAVIHAGTLTAPTLYGVSAIELLETLRQFIRH
jgi:hypothetical protein